MKGYKEAQKVEDSIIKLMREYPIDSCTAIEWLRFTRTVKVTCQLLEETIMQDILSGKIVRTR